MKIYTKKNSKILLVLACLFTFHRLSFALDISGEIININSNHNIAFIDLGKDSINTGDIFSVETTAGTVYLEVVETSSAVSKLSVSTKSNFKSSLGDFQSVTIGVTANRVLNNSLKDRGSSIKDLNTNTDATVSGIPNIDPQVLVKPNIANETIQSLDARLDKMVESNVKLFNTLTELLNEKKQWQLDIDQVRSQLQSAKNQVQNLNLLNVDLKKQLADANFQTTNAVADNEKNKKLFEDAQSKLQELKKRLDSLKGIIQDRLK